MNLGIINDVTNLSFEVSVSVAAAGTGAMQLRTPPRHSIQPSIEASPDLPRSAVPRPVDHRLVTANLLLLLYYTKEYQCIFFL